LFYQYKLKRCSKKECCKQCRYVKPINSYGCVLAFNMHLLAIKGLFSTLYILFSSFNLLFLLYFLPYIHSTTFLIGHFYFAVISTSTQPISSKFSAFYTDVCLYRNPLKLASLLSRSVVQLFNYWFLHFLCDVIIWNTQIITNWLVMFYNVYCCIKNILYYVNFDLETALLKIKKTSLTINRSRKIISY